MGWVHGMIMRIISTEPSSWMQYCFTATYFLTITLNESILHEGERAAKCPFSVIDDTLSLRRMTRNRPMEALNWHFWHDAERINESIASSFFIKCRHIPFDDGSYNERKETENATFHSSKDPTTKKQRVAYAFAIKTLLLAGRWQSTNSTCVVPRQQSRHTRE
jgi:hypothetical protein